MPDGSGRLEGRTALVTGAAQGIGLAVAQRLAEEGALLVLVDIAPMDVTALAGRAPAEIVQGDVAEEDTLRAAVTRAVECFGTLDILVNNAYAAVQKSITDLTAGEWRRTLDVSLDSVFYACKYAVPVMRGQGRGAIVNISSINAVVTTPGRAAYVAAKGAVDALTRQMAVEYGPDGIRTNGIRPGLIATPAVEAILSDEAEREAAVESCPLRKVGAPRDVADAALFLASDEAAYINGVILNVDGGTSVQWPPVLVRPSLRRQHFRGR